jgi:hypothetical protein
MIRYAVLRSRDELDELFEQLESGLHEVQRRTGLLFAYAYTEEAPGAKIHIWREQRSNNALIRLVDDQDIPTRYLVIEAADAQTAEAILEALASSLDLATLLELQDMAREAMDREPGLVVRMALATGESADAMSVGLIARALRSPDANLREAGVLAAALTRWHVFLAELERMYEEEADPSAREILAQAIADVGGEQ